MITQTFDQVVTDVMGAIINYEHPGFPQDYLILHSLLKTHKPETVFEVGTNFGTGTKIICNALPKAVVYSLELPKGEGDEWLLQGEKDMTGIHCTFTFTQLRGNSTEFDYSLFPCEAYYIDAEHTYNNVYQETILIQREAPKIIIYHDSDIPEVLEAIQDAMNENYHLYRVTDTRIAYLLRK